MPPDDEEIRQKMGPLLTICFCWTVSVFNSNADAQIDARSVEVVQGKFAAFNQHDVAAIESRYAEGALLNSPDHRNLVGNKPIADTYRKIFDTIPDAKDEIELIEAAGSHVYVRFVMSGHWSGLPDKPISVRIIAVYKVAAGRIVDDATYYDRKAP